MNEVSIVVTGTKLDLAIIGWLDEKKQLSQSKKTEKSYADTLYQFRAALQYRSLDLDRLDARPTIQGMSERQLVTLTAQDFAKWSARGKEVAATTKNQRLSVLSSFYEYAITNDFLDYNPIKKVKRSKVQQYKTSKALTREVTTQGLASIDTTTLRGKRDYAMLAVLLATGRRMSEVASLQWRDVYIGSDDNVTLNFPRLKGGKEISDVLGKKTSQALLVWLRAYYNEGLKGIAQDAPLWVSLAPGGRYGKSYGQPLSIRSFSDVHKKYFGTGKVHRSRHTWTRNMLQAKAPLPLIKKKLTHNSLATTGIYAEALESVDNPYIDDIADSAGI